VSRYDREQVFVRRDGTTFVQKVPPCESVVCAADYDPEIVALRAFASAVSMWFMDAKPSGAMSDAAEHLFRVSCGRYGWPKGFKPARRPR